MHLQLITYKAGDRLELDGAYYTATGTARTSAPLIVITHGAWMNFYTGPPRFLPSYLVPDGFDCLAINGRDHDLGGMHPVTGRCYGMLRCRFEDVLKDLAGALAWGQKQGYRRFVLISHSYSAPRSAYYLSRRPEEGIEALVMLSPPPGMDTVHRHWLDDWAGFAQRARQFVDAGQEDEIVIDRPAKRFPVIASARTVVNLWVDNPMEDSTFIQGITVPLLLTLGEKEVAEDPARRNIERIASLWAGPLRRTVIPGAGHYYHENRAGLASAILAWLHDGAISRRPASAANGV